MLNVENPSAEVLKQKRAVQYILGSVLDGPNSKDKGSMERLRLLVMGLGAVANRLSQERPRTCTDRLAKAQFLQRLRV